MQSYSLYTCPNCEGHFRVVWPDPLPSQLHLCSKVKITCAVCGELTELYVFLLDRIGSKRCTGIGPRRDPISQKGQTDLLLLFFPEPYVISRLGLTVFRVLI